MVRLLNFVKLWTKKNIITYISLLIFIFPLIYQPLHVTLHHSVFHSHHDNNNGDLSTNENCLVYEYQFASFDLPNETFVESPFIDKPLQHIPLYKESAFKKHLCNLSARAPPYTRFS